MKSKFFKLKRAAYITIALAMAWVGVGQGLVAKRAYAFPVGGQVQQRKIKMSSSVVSATGVSYEVSFNAATSYNIHGIILDFCDASSTPIIGDSTCTAPAGFSVGASPTISVSGGANTLGGTWTTSSLNSNRTLKATNSATTALTASSTYVFTLTGVTNTSALGTFYARFITYSSTSGDIASYAPGTEGSTDATDYGGFALSTANVISITAKVQESMTFCVSGAAPTSNCGGVTTPALIIGHGANNILDASAVDTSQAFTQLSTNANTGAIIRIRNTSASGGLNAGTNSIPAAGATPVAFVAGTAKFGLFVANGAGGTGTITADAGYNDGTSTHYGMDISSTDNVLTTYGDAIASASAPVNNVAQTLTFAATASNTTAAGIYTANIIVICTGSF